jgi:hypothetical protein
MNAAEPAVDAVQLDGIGVPCKDGLAVGRRCQLVGRRGRPHPLRRPTRTARIAGKRVDADEPSSPSPAPVGKQIEDLNELELVVEVGLEPEQNVVGAASARGHGPRSTRARRKTNRGPTRPRNRHERGGGRVERARRERAPGGGSPARSGNRRPAPQLHGPDDRVAVRDVERRQPARTSFTCARPFGSVIQMT